MVQVTEVILIVIGISAVAGLFLTVIELRRSKKVAISNTEATIVTEYNKWTWEYGKDRDLKTLGRVMNLLESLIKNVERHLYPFEEYKDSFLPATIYYLHEYEKIIKSYDYFRNYFNRYHRPLNPVFELYDEKIKQFLNGRDRTVDNINGFMNSEYSTPNEDELKKLKERMRIGKLMELKRKISKVIKKLSFQR